MMMIRRMRPIPPGMKIPDEASVASMCRWYPGSACPKRPEAGFVMRHARHDSGVSNGWC